MPIYYLCFFIAIIHLIATLSYGVRIAGARTGKVAFCLSLFNILVLVSRTSNTLLTPALSKRVESGIDTGITAGLQHEFHLLIFSASAATLVGAALIPTFQRYVTSVVGAFDRFPSLPMMVKYSLSGPGLQALGSSWRIPAKANFNFLAARHRLPWNIFAMNVVGSALLATGVLSSLYAGVFAPELRMTTGQLSAVVNFFGTILLFAFVDPYLSYVTDGAAKNAEDGDSRLRAAVFGMAGSRLLGTVLAHFLMIPGAHMIAWIARIIPA
jgi:hypothetical protein